MLKLASFIWIAIIFSGILAGNSNGSQSDGECTECKWISIGSTSAAASDEKTAKFIVGPPTIFENVTIIEANEEVLNHTGRVTEGVPAPTTPSEILAVHNAYRAEVGMPPLVWSTTLASYAQNWANFLVANGLFQHSGGPYGENLAGGWPSSYWSDTLLVNLWGGEKQYFKCGTFPDVSTTGNWQDVGHYTQMIWPTTIELGCGIASSDAYGKCLVCEYNPPGNWIGAYICPADKIGVFRNGPWYLDSYSDKIWGEGDISTWFGTSGDLPIAGDWNGDGKDEIGVFRNGPWYLDYNGNRVWDSASGDVSFWFGTGGDLPIAGDWNGDGIDEIGVFRNGPWYLDYNGNRVWDPESGDVSFWFGTSGDLPIAGDWNGDGKDKIGVFRNGPWYLDYNGNRIWDPASGDVSFWFGTSGDAPLAGDWNSDGRDEIGIFRNGPWYLDHNGNRIWDPASGDVSFWFGTNGDKPVAAQWS